MDMPELIRRDSMGNRVSAWVLGVYENEGFCPFRVVRACKNGDKIEWEEPDGFGEFADTFPVKAPDTWKHLEE